MRRDARPWLAAVSSVLISLGLAATPALPGAIEALSIDPPFVSKNTAPASAPAVIRGIGFTPSTTVTFDGAAASVTFVDSRTLNVLVPTSATGKAARVTVTDGADSDDIFPFIYTDLNLYVRTTGNDASNGTTPALAKQTIGGALSDASTTSTTLIRIAAGTYAEFGLAVGSGVVLSGGWDPNYAMRNPDQFVTVLDAGKNGFAMRSLGLDARQVIDGITVRNGVRDGLGGGAFIISGDNTVITNSVFVGNISSARGGAIYGVFSTAYGGESILSNNVLLGNRSFAKGGGGINLYPLYTQGQVIDVAISDNFILGNRAMISRGGGLEVSSQASYGYNVMRVDLVGNVIGGNRAITGGGASFITSSSGDTYDLRIDNNLLFSNLATGEGGGIYFSGVGHVSGKVTGSTIVDNTAGLDGGGGVQFSPSVSYVSGFAVENLISWNNLNGNLVGSPLATFSDIGGGSSGTGNLSADPVFVAGGLGKFFLAQDANTMSPAVDSGSAMAEELSMEARTTSLMLSVDTGMVDMGFHYPASVGPSPDPIAFTRIDPSSGDLAGAEWVLIRGQGFDPGAAVTFGGTPATETIYASATRILAQPPPHPLGAVDVEVTNPDMTSVLAAGAYTYADNLPPDWLTTVGLQSAASNLDCVRTALLTWNPAVDLTTPPVIYSIYREECIPDTVDLSHPCTNFGYFPSAANFIGTTTNTFYVDPNFPSGGADKKYIYLIRGSDGVPPPANTEFNYSKRIVLVRKLTGDLSPPSPVGETLEVPTLSLLDWEAAVGALSYRVYREIAATSYATPGSLVPLITLTSANNDLNADGVTDTQYTDATLPADGTAFFYRITGLDACSNETVLELGL